jgi:tripartite ATP-independent transporter DctM subunit
MIFAIIMILSFFVFIAIGVPIVLALLASSLTYLVLNPNLSLLLVPIKLFRSTDAFVFLSVPLFILAGKLMNMTGTTASLINFSNMLVGRLRGGLAHVNIVVSMFFGGCTGAAISDTSAVGSALIPSMEQNGYPKDFSAAVTAASSTMGPIIPPSLAFILYGAVSNISIGDLFLAGIIPGILVGVFQMFVVAYYAKKLQFPKRENRLSFSEIIAITKEASWALMLPVIIVGGISTGFCTPTEAAAIAVFYSLFVGMAIHRNLTFSDILASMRESAIESGAIMVIVAAAALFGWVLAMEQIPMKLAEFLTQVATSPWQVLILINIGLLVLGMFMDYAPAVILIAPILLPLYAKLGMDPLQAGVMTCVNLITGLATPPVGCCLFAASVISGESYEKICLAILPFIFMNLLVLGLITYLPFITTFIPRIMFGH